MKRRASIIGEKTMVYDFSLRPDFLAQVVVPRDLTVEEVWRLAAMLLTLAVDASPGVVASILHPPVERPAFSIDQDEG